MGPYTKVNMYTYVFMGSTPKRFRKRVVAHCQVALWIKEKNEELGPRAWRFWAESRKAVENTFMSKINDSKNKATPYSHTVRKIILLVEVAWCATAWWWNKWYIWKFVWRRPKTGPRVIWVCRITRPHLTLWHRGDALIDLPMNNTYMDVWMYELYIRMSECNICKKGSMARTAPQMHIHACLHRKRNTTII